MARICFLCNGKVSSNPFRAYSNNDLKDDERIIPEGMSDKDKVCSRCFDHNKDIRKISGLEYPQNEEEEESHYVKKPTSSAIWILPILLGFVGGLIMYFIIMNDDKPKAQNGLVLGIVLTIIPAIIYFVFFAAAIAL